MPTPKEQVTATVDAMVKAGRIQEAMRQQYVDLLAANDELAAEFGGMFMRHGDYTKKTQELAAARRQQEQELAAERQRVQAEHSRLQQWEQQARAEMDQLRAQQWTPERAARLAALEATIKNYGIEEQVLAAASAAAPPAPTTPVQQPRQPEGAPAMTDKKYLTEDAAASYLREVMQIQGKAMAIAGKHQQLFGQPLTDDIINESLATGQDPEVLWKTKYNVEARQAEMQAQAHAAELEKVRQETRAAVMAELASDPSRLVAPAGLGFDQAPSPLMQARDRIAAAERSGEKVVAPEQVSIPMSHLSRVDAAMAAFNKQFTMDGNQKAGGGPAQ